MQFGKSHDETAHLKQPFFIYLACDTPHAKLQNPPCAYPPGGGLKGGVREPTLACWPGVIPAGRSDDQPSGQWDWLTTFAELAGVPAPAASDGVSLLPSLTGRGTQMPSTLYIEYFNGGRTPAFEDFAPAHRGRERKQIQVIFLDGYTGVRYNVQSADDNFEIYNLAKDEHETHNLAARRELAGLQAAMAVSQFMCIHTMVGGLTVWDKSLIPRSLHMT